MAKQEVAKAAHGHDKARALAERETDRQQSLALMDEDTRRFLEQAGGQEDLVGRDVVAIPFLTILQPLSPEVNPADAKYIEGAKPGNILHTVSKEASMSVQVIPVVHQRSFLEWVPRDAGGGFRGEHTGADVVELFMAKIDRATGRARLDNGNDLVDTRNFFVLQVREDGSLSPALITMSSTQIKASKNWNAMMRDFRPETLPVRPGALAPLAAGVYNLFTMMQENKKGKWFGWNIKRIQETPAEMLAQAARFYKQVKGNEVLVDRSEPVNEEDDDAL